jgi:hypothetical protein
MRAANLIELPVRVSKPRRANGARVVFLKPEETLAVLRAAKERSVRDWAMILLAYRHGLRASEVCGLRLTDVDLKDCAISIQRLKGSLQTVQPLFAHRGQPLLDEVAALRSWLKVRLADGSGYLFTSQKGGRLDRTQYFRIFQAVAETAGLPAEKSHGYTATRDNLLGSGGWGRTVETVSLLSFPKNDDTSGRRNLTIVLRNAPAEKFPLKFVDGQLEIDPDSHEEDDGKAGQASLDIEWYQTQARLAEKNPAKKWWTILDAERALNLSHATADRHVKNDHTKGHIIQKTRGKDQGLGRPAAEYRWNDSKTNPIWVEQRQQEQDDQGLAFR